MTTKAKRVRTVRPRRRTTEATYEEQDEITVEPQRKIDLLVRSASKKTRMIHEISKLEKHIDIFVDTFIAIGIEGLRKQFRDELSLYRASNDRYKFKAFEAHPDKNRYKDVVCLDETRVHLTLDVPPSTDYIHANWVKFEGHDKVFIATQSPLDNTIEDFWRMVFQEGCPYIVNLTKCVEDGKVKASQYWPLEAGQYKTYGKMFVNTKKVESDGKFMIYTVEVLPEGYSESIVAKLLHVTTWPDRGLPISGRHVLRLIRQVAGNKLDTGPIVIQCLAGIGRTGTIILIDIILRRLFTYKEVDLPQLFKTLRNQRASCIQLEGQYVFIIVSVLNYIKIKYPKYKTRVDKYIADYRNAHLSS